MSDRIPIVCLTDEQKAHARATMRSCVVCHARYEDDEDRSGLHVYPDGCTAHDACYISERGLDTRHWHNKTVVCEDCGEREPTTDIGCWLCDECAERYRAGYARPAAEQRPE